MLHVFGEDDFLLDELLGQLVVSFLVFGQNLLGAFVLLVHHPLHFLVDEFGGLFAIGTVEGIFVVVVVAQVGQLLAHAQVGYHAIGLLGDALQVVHGACRDTAQEEVFGSTSAQGGAHLVEHLLLGCDLPFFGQVPGGTQGPSARHDGHLDERVGILQQPGDAGVSCLVDGDGAAFLFGGDLGLLLQSAHDAVYGIEEVLLAHEFLAVAGSYQGGFVAHVGDVRAREARRLTGQQVNVYRIVYLDGAQVYAKHFLAFVQVGQVHMDLAVEAACTQQGLVEHVHAVGGGQDDDAAVRAEAVHLGEQLVERVLALVVATHGGRFGAGASHGVNLVDEDDAGSLLLGLAEEVAYTRGAYADEHLHEVRTCQREEGHVGFACHGLGQQGLSCARRAYQQGAFGYLAAQFGIFLRFLEELHDFFHFLLGFGQSGHVLERHLGARAFLEELSLRLADVEDASSAAYTSSAVHASHQEHPEADNEEDGHHVPQDEAHVVGSLFVGDGAVKVGFILFFLEEVAQAFARGGFGGDHRVAAHAARVVAEHISHVLGLDVGFHGVVVVAHHAADVSLLHVALEFVVGDVLGGSTVFVGQPQAHEHHEDDHVEPVQVELGHVDLVVSSVFLIDVVVHKSVLIDIGYLG